MRGEVMRKLALLLSIIAVPLAFTATAAANSTQTEIVTEHVTIPFDQATAACGFPVDQRIDGSFKVVSFFDNDGTLLKTIATNFGGPFTVTATNPATGKRATAQSQTLVEIVTFNPDGSVASDSANGLRFNFVVPGLGVILKATGRVVFDGEGNLIFEAGPHAFLDGDTAAFCDYLADS